MNRRTNILTLALAGIAALNCGCLTAGANDGDVFTPLHVAKIRHVTTTRISPDGQQIAYLLGVPRHPMKDDDGGAWTELHVVDKSGTSRPFITGKINIGGIEWTPDGKNISFTTKRGDDKFSSLYVIPIDGGEARRVLTHETGVGSYSWSPDGKMVAFLATAPESKEEKKLKEKGFTAIVYEEDDKPTRVWLGTPDAMKDSEKACPIELAGSVSMVRWSPAGDRLLVAVAPSSLIDDEYMNRKFHVLNAKDGSVVAKIETPGKLGDARWSPDGKHFAFIGAADRNDPAEGRLFVVSAEGGTPREILPDFEGHVTDIAWQDNETVMYLGDIGVWSRFGKVSLSGEKKTLIAEGTHVLRSFSVSSDGQCAAFVSDSASHGMEVFAMCHGDHGPRRLTDSNDWMSKLRFATQEPIRYTARDGVELEGILFRPLDEQPGKRYPLILAVHGGPEAHESMGWRTDYSRPGQLAAARGFAVFMPNYRGSTGRGVAFSKLSQSDYGGKEFDDLIDAIDHLDKMGLVDPKKVGVTGGSYGGFASAWCATKHTERFAASVMFVGISDQISKYGTTDIPQEMHEVHSLRWPWDDWQYFLERSPIYHTPKARTPILIMHGRDDTRVHTSQSMELYRYLKTLGNVPVRLVLFPGEGHGNRKAAARFDYCLRMMRWMEHYLQGPGGDAPAYELDYDAALGIEKDDAEKAKEEAGEHK